MAFSRDFDERPLSVGEWLVTLIVAAIPIVNLIALLWWAFSSGGNLNRRNWARASLVLMLVAVFVMILLSGLGLAG